MTRLIIGSIAGVLCTISFLPQAIKIYRTKNTAGLSLITFSALGLGVFFWLIYGLMMKELPIILANAVTFILVLSIVIMKIRYK